MGRPCRFGEHVALCATIAGSQTRVPVCGQPAAYTAIVRIDPAVGIALRRPARHHHRGHRPDRRCLMDRPIIRVTARDLELGDEDVHDLKPGQYVVVCAEPLYVAHEQRHPNGTVQLTLKRRERS